MLGSSGQYGCVITHMCIPPIHSPAPLATVGTLVAVPASETDSRPLEEHLGSPRQTIDAASVGLTGTHGMRLHAAACCPDMPGAFRFPPGGRGQPHAAAPRHAPCAPVPSSQPAPMSMAGSRTGGLLEIVLSYHT